MLNIGHASTLIQAAINRPAVLQLSLIMLSATMTSQALIAKLVKKNQRTDKHRRSLFIGRRRY